MNISSQLFRLSSDTGNSINSPGVTASSDERDFQQTFSQAVTSSTDQSATLNQRRTTERQSSSTTSLASQASTSSSLSVSKNIASHHAVATPMHAKVEKESKSKADAAGTGAQSEVNPRSDDADAKDTASTSSATTPDGLSNNTVVPDASSVTAISTVTSAEVAAVSSILTSGNPAANSLNAKSTAPGEHDSDVVGLAQMPKLAGESSTASGVDQTSASTTDPSTLNDHLLNKSSSLAAAGVTGSGQLHASAGAASPKAKTVVEDSGSSDLAKQQGSVSSDASNRAVMNDIRQNDSRHQVLGFKLPDGLVHDGKSADASVAKNDLQSGGATNNIVDPSLTQTSNTSSMSATSIGTSSNVNSIGKTAGVNSGTAASKGKSGAEARNGASGLNDNSKDSNASLDAQPGAKGTDGAADSTSNGSPSNTSSNSPQSEQSIAGLQPNMPPVSDPASGQDRHSATNPDASGASANPTSATPASTQPVAESMPAVNSAQLIQSMHQSEMRLGMHSTEFGNLSISTSLNRQTLSAQISTDHAELGRALAMHLPAMEAKLGSAYGMQARVEIHDGANTSSYSNSGEQAKENRQSQSNGSNGSNGSGRSAATGSTMTNLDSAAGSNNVTTPSMFAKESRLDIRI